MSTQSQPATQSQPSSQHLAAALQLLNELEAATKGSKKDRQTQAAIATAHAILVLAEQVAAIRVLLVGNALSQRTEEAS